MKPKRNPVLAASNGSDARRNSRAAANEAARIRDEVKQLRRVGIDLRDKYLPIARECESEARYWLRQVQPNAGDKV